VDFVCGKLMAAINNVAKCDHCKILADEKTPGLDDCGNSHILLFLSKIIRKVPICIVFDLLGMQVQDSCTTGNDLKSGYPDWK
jgi:hypothetical protein